MPPKVRHPKLENIRKYTAEESRTVRKGIIVTRLKLEWDYLSPEQKKNTLGLIVGRTYESLNGIPQEIIIGLVCISDTLVARFIQGGRIFLETPVQLEPVYSGYTDIVATYPQGKELYADVRTTLHEKEVGIYVPREVLNSPNVVDNLWNDPYFIAHSDYSLMWMPEIE